MKIDDYLSLMSWVCLVLITVLIYAVDSRLDALEEMSRTSPPVVMMEPSEQVSLEERREIFRKVREALEEEE